MGQNSFNHKWFNFPILWVGKDRSPPSKGEANGESWGMIAEFRTAQLLVLIHNGSSPIARLSKKGVIPYFPEGIPCGGYGISTA